MDKNIEDYKSVLRTTTPKAEEYFNRNKDYFNEEIFNAVDKYLNDQNIDLRFSKESVMEIIVSNNYFGTHRFLSNLDEISRVSQDFLDREITKPNPDYSAILSNIIEIYRPLLFDVENSNCFGDFVSRTTLEIMEELKKRNQYENENFMENKSDIKRGLSNIIESEHIKAMDYYSNVFTSDLLQMIDYSSHKLYDEIQNKKGTSLSDNFKAFKDIPETNQSIKSDNASAFKQFPEEKTDNASAFQQFPEEIESMEETSLSRHFR